MSLTNPTNGAVIGSPASATVTITDDDDMLEIPGLQLNEFFGSVVAKLGPKLIIGAPGFDNGAGGFATVGFYGPTIDETYFPAPPFGSGVGRALSVDGLNVLVGGLSNVYHYHDPVLGNASPDAFDPERARRVRLRRVPDLDPDHRRRAQRQRRYGRRHRL